jgi:hypothetical protein
MNCLSDHLTPISDTLYTMRGFNGSGKPKTAELLKRSNMSSAYERYKSRQSGEMGWAGHFTAHLAANLVAVVVIFLGVRWYVLGQMAEFGRNLEKSGITSKN